VFPPISLKEQQGRVTGNSFLFLETSMLADEPAPTSAVGRFRFVLSGKTGGMTGGTTGATTGVTAAAGGTAV